MAASKRLSLATKALCVIQDYAPEAITSNQIAEALDVNPSKLRRILSVLVKARLIESSQGTRGGFILKKQAEKISLQEVYCAVEDKKAFYLDVHENSDAGSTSAKINDLFFELFADVQIVIENHMAQITIADLIKKID